MTRHNSRTNKTNLGERKKELPTHNPQTILLSAAKTKREYTTYTKYLRVYSLRSRRETYYLIEARPNLMSATRPRYEYTRGYLCKCGGRVVARKNCEWGERGDEKYGRKSNFEPPRVLTTSAEALL